MAVFVLFLFLKAPWVCLRFVIVAIPGHTHLRFWVLKNMVRGFSTYLAFPEKFSVNEAVVKILF